MTSIAWPVSPSINTSLIPPSTFSHNKLQYHQLKHLTTFSPPFQYLGSSLQSTFPTNQTHLILRIFPQVNIINHKITVLPYPTKQLRIMLTHQPHQLNTAQADTGEMLLLPIEKTPSSTIIPISTHNQSKPLKTMSMRL